MGDLLRGLDKEIGGERSPHDLRALAVDRHALFLAALERLLSGAPLHAEVVTTTRSVEAIEIVKQRPIDVVFCDVRMEAVDGTALPALLLGLRPELRIIMLADVDDESLLLASERSGAVGFFTKDTPVQEFLEGVEAVLSGQYAVSRNLVQKVLKARARLGDDDRPPGINRLSQAERGILSLIGQAYSVRSIAAVQGVSQKTVRNHLASVYRKLHLHNRAEAVLWAARMSVTGESIGLAPTV